MMGRALIMAVFLLAGSFHPEEAAAAQRVTFRTEDGVTIAATVRAYVDVLR